MKRMFNLELDAETAVTVGKFDALHKGHLRLLRALQNAAGERGLKSVVLAFEPSPESFFRGNPDVFVLTDRERDYILSENKIYIDVWKKVPFGEHFAELSREEFVNSLRNELNVRLITAGEDFRFGKNCEGNIEYLRGLEGIMTRVVEHGENKISGSSVRQAIAAADFASLECMLNYNYFIMGNVVRRKGLGRKLGFPTANIPPDSRKLLPPDGVYITKTIADGLCRDSITNIGASAVAGEKKRLVETHIIGFDGELYGKEIIVKFTRKLRGAMIFSNLDELKNQIQRDIERAFNP